VNFSIFGIYEFALQLKTSMTMKTEMTSTW